MKNRNKAVVGVALLQFLHFSVLVFFESRFVSWQISSIGLFVFTRRQHSSGAAPAAGGSQPRDSASAGGGDSLSRSENPMSLEGSGEEAA